MNKKKLLKTDGEPIRPRPSLQQFVQLPEEQTIVSVQPYREEHIQYPKWKFWRNQKVKYYLAVVTDKGRLYIIDPDSPSVTEVEDEQSEK